MIPFDRMVLLKQTITATAVTQTSAGGLNEQTFTVPGLLTTDIILAVVKPSTTDGVAVINARVSATSVAALTFINPSSAQITPTSAQSYQFCIVRPEKYITTGSLPFVAM